MPLHADEFTIDDEVVATLVREQMPQWSHLELSRLETSGTVNVTYRLGDHQVVRLPRTEAFSDGPLREATWLPVFAEYIPLRVPRHLALGQPTPEYPSHWSVLEWIPGATADASTLGDPDEAAMALGEVVGALRHVPTRDAPTGGSYRAGSLLRVDEDVRRWTDRLPADIDRHAVIAAWEACASASPWDGPAVWLHSDLRGDNLIVADGRLVGVIDWEGCAVGDPSADHIAAWWLFDGDSRRRFREASGADAATWNRAKGWALHMAVAAIPYYRDSNPGFAASAGRALSAVLSDA